MDCRGLPPPLGGGGGSISALSGVVRDLTLKFGCVPLICAMVELGSATLVPIALMLIGGVNKKLGLEFIGISILRRPSSDPFKESKLS